MSASQATATSGKRPLVYACSGGAGLARLANELAQRLDTLGLAEMGSAAAVGAGVETALARARSGRAVLIIDGCAHACVTRLLAERDVHPDRRVLLTGLGLDEASGARADCEDVLSLVTRSFEPLLPRPRQRRAAGTATPHTPARTTRPSGSTDAYLRAIQALEQRQPRVRAAEVARVLDVSRASAGEMIGRLEREGLIERDERRRLRLSEAGRARADSALHRHDVVERFLVGFLGYSSPDAHRAAEQLNAGLDEAMVERIHEALERVAAGEPATAIP